jgi:aryl-alcohol dehydrogenase-like predicted oxidoreductase
MEKRRLGRSDLEITPVGFGAWAIGGGDWQFGWGAQDDDASIEAIRRSIDLGINWIDTAAVYGLGRSEEVVARALEGVPSSSRPYVFTKASLVWGEDRKVGHSLEPGSLRREVEASLRRLKVDTIDLYQIHWPSFGGKKAEPAALEAAWSTFAAFQREGKVRHIGVSNFSVDEMKHIASIATIASLQPPYSMLMREVEADILPWCQENEVGVIVYSPMHSGLLTGAMTHERVQSFPKDDWRRNNPAFQEPALTKNLALAGKLGEIGARHGRSAGEVAIAWTLRLPAVTGAIVGARSASQVEGWVAAGSFRLTDDETAEIERGLQAT